MAETMTVEAAEAALAAARVDVENARKREEEEFGHLRVISAELAWSIDDKNFAKKAAHVEETRLKVDVLRTRINLFHEKVEEARRTLEAAREAADQSKLLTTRQRFEELKQLLAEDGKQLEVLVRQTRVKLIDRVRAHRAVVEQANRLGNAIFEADHPELLCHEYREESSPWQLSRVGLAHDQLLGAQGVLAALEDVVDDIDRAAWSELHPRPPPYDAWAAAEANDRKRILERIQQEAAEKRLPPMRELGVTREELESMQLEHAKQAAIDAKAARDNPTSSFPGDVAPTVG